MNPLVSLVRQPDYAAAGVRAAVERLLQPLGGLAAFVHRGDRVVLKPNLVLGYPPEKAVTTHPSVVRAVAELALDCGARVSIGDSPGIGSGQSAGEKAGLGEVARDLGLEWIEFSPMEVVDEKRLFQKLTLARELLEADAVINLAKLKTHCQMTMTMAVKNLFGAVVSLQKFQWHYRAGRDKAVFARMIYEICRTVKPRLSVVDAIVAMDGNGPTHGDPNPTGFLAAGADPCAVDAILLDVLGIPRDSLYTLQAARAAGDTAWTTAEAVGEMPDALRPARWRLPEAQSMEMHGPGFLRRIPGLGRWLRSQVTAVPRPLSTCVRCGACVRLCPAKAMTLAPDELRIDEALCIRCYCCHELCPHGAMGLRKGWLGKVLGVFGK